MKNMSFIGQPNYCISQDGKIFSLKSNRFLKHFHDAQGYCYIECYENKTKSRFSVHRLVAFAFIPNPENKPEVNHIDGDKSNNKVSNLEWVTAKENMRHAIITGLRDTGNALTDEQVHAICKQLCDGVRVIDIARMYGVDRAIISCIKNKKTYEYISNEYDFSDLNKIDKLSIEKVIKVCEMLQDGITFGIISKELGIKSYLISRIKRRIHFRDISSNYCW